MGYAPARKDPTNAAHTQQAVFGLLAPTLTGTGCCIPGEGADPVSLSGLGDQQLGLVSSPYSPDGRRSVVDGDSYFVVLRSCR